MREPAWLEGDEGGVAWVQMSCHNPGIPGNLTSYFSGFGRAFRAAKILLYPCDPPTPLSVFARKQGIFTSNNGVREYILGGRGSRGYSMPGGELPGTGPLAKLEDL